jgi:hypothetical protein
MIALSVVSPVTIADGFGHLTFDRKDVGHFAIKGQN